MGPLVQTLQVLAEPRRHAIVELLSGGERCLCDISEALDVSDQLASHHVKRLRDAGIVLTSRKGLWLHCRLDPHALDRIADALSALADRARASEPREGGLRQGCCDDAPCEQEGGR